MNCGIDDLADEDDVVAAVVLAHGTHDRVAALPASTGAVGPSSPLRFGVLRVDRRSAWRCRSGPRRGC